jgi:hypothetical protein
MKSQCNVANVFPALAGDNLEQSITQGAALAFIA